MSLDTDSWQSRYFELQENYRAVKKKNREQAKMSRQLIEAVKTKLQQTDRYIHEVIMNSLNLNCIKLQHFMYFLKISNVDL